MATKKKLLEAAAGASLTPDTGDPEFANVVLLLDGDGTSGAANNTFTDSSTNGYTVTESGSVVQGSFSPYGDNWSNYFASGANVLKFADSADFDLGTTWTVEAWIFPNAANSSKIFSTRNGSGNMWELLIYASDKKFAFEGYGANNTSGPQKSSSTFEPGQWYHVAVVTSSSATKLYVDGVLEVNYSNSYTWSTAYGPWIGGNSAFSEYSFDGYVSNLRVVKGTAVYTGAFTPPTEPLTAITNTVLLTCQSNNFVDNSTSAHSITITGTPKVTPFSPFKNDDARDITTDGGSAYFDGSSDLASSGSVNWSTYTNITLEAWVYPTSLSSNAVQVLIGTSDGTFGYTIFYLYSDGRIGVGINGVNEIASSSGAVIDNEWQHVAAVKSGSTTTLYVNGVSVASATTAIWTNNSAVVRVGRAGTTNRFYGYMSDARVVLGTAIVPSTLPTSPLTAVTNTELLLNFQDAGIYDRSGINNLDTVGDARLGFAPIYGTGSLAFDGSGDYLTTNSLTELSFGTGDFTIEGWFYVQSGDEFPYILDFRSAASQAVPVLYFYNYGNGSIGWAVNGSDRILGTSAGNDVWQHIAVCRSGTSTKMFVNGTQSGSTYTDSTNYAAYSGNIARRYTDNRYFKGYIDDLRITKGVARYTSNFTPPTEIDLALDTHAEYVTLFLDGDGPANGQNNTFTDSSTNGFTVTESGSVVQGVFSPYGDNWSNYFASSGLLIADSTDFDFGTGDFTMEAWVFPAALDGSFDESTIISVHEGTDNTAYAFSIWSDGRVQLYGGGGNRYYSTSTVSLNEWSHVMVTRSSGTVRFFVNGTLDASSHTATGNFNCTSSGLGIGRQPAGTYQGSPVTRYWNGWLSNVRMVKGTALQTSSFTTSTSPLTAVTNTSLLACQSNRFVDNSSSSHTLTLNGTPKVTRFSPFESDKPYDITTDGGSGDFNGSEYLTVTTDSNLSFSNYAGDFTVEAWFYPTAVAQSSGSWLWFQGETGSGYSPFIIYQNPSTYNFTMYASSNGSSWNLASAATIGTAQANAWNHIAIVRDGTNIKCYMNGVLGSTTAVSTTAFMTTTGNVVIGSALGNANTYLNGYVSNLRAVKGSVVYSSPFTPPTSPLTAITNTELLLNFQDSAIPDLSGLNNIDTVGNAKVGASDPTKYGSNAMQFDGSGDYLQTIPTEELYFTGKDFTVEGWVYLNNLSSSQTLFYYGSTNRSTSNASGIAFSVLYYSVPNYFRASAYYASTGGFAANNTLVTPSANQWYHVAYYRIGSQFYLAINGNVANIGSFTQPLLNGSAWVFRAGIESDSIGQPLNGYLDDIRITMGKARYGTSNFTPPDAALPKF